MRALKRITQSITVGIESLIDQVENQEVPGIALLALPAIWGLRGRRAEGIQLAGTAATAIGLVLAVGELRLALPLVGAVLLVSVELMPRARARALAWAAWATLLHGTWLACVDSDGWSALLGLPIAGAHMVSAYRRRAGWQVVAFGGALVLTLLGQLWARVHLPVDRLWIPAAALSFCMLILSSLLERHRGSIERIAGRLRARFAQQEG